MSNEKPEALELADIFENLAHPTGTRYRAAKELRRLHTRVEELEAMLDAVDALDAARYRYLRDVDWRYRGELEAVIRLQANALWDVKIDEAIAAQTRSQGDSA